MRRFRLADCGDRGWFVGDFDKAILRTTEFEVAVQHNARGVMPSHIHHEVTEIVLIISGKVLLNGEILTEGDGAVLQPGEVNQLEYLETTKILAIKTPSRPQDKELL